MTQTNSAPSLDPSEQSLALQASELRWLARRVAAHGGELRVVLLPPRSAVVPIKTQTEVERAETKTWHAMQTSVKVACEAAGIPFKDLTPALRLRARTDAAPLYYQGLDTHPNPSGYRAFAQELASWLETTASP